MASDNEWPWYLITILIIFIVLVILTAIVLIWCCCRCWTEEGTWWTTRRRRKRRYVNMADTDPIYGYATPRKTDGLRLKTLVNDSINITLKPGEDGGPPALQAGTIDNKHRKYRKRKWKSYLVPAQTKFKQIPRYFRGRRGNSGGVTHVMTPGDDLNSFRSLPPARKRKGNAGFRSQRGDASMRRALSWHGANSDYTLVRVVNSLGESSEAKPDSFFRNQQGPTGLDTYRPSAIARDVSIIGPVRTNSDTTSNGVSVNGYSPVGLDSDNIFRSADPPNVLAPRGTYSHTISMEPGVQGQLVVDPTYTSAPVLKHERAHVYHGGNANVEAPIVPEQATLYYDQNTNNNNMAGTYYVTVPSTHM